MITAAVLWRISLYDALFPSLCCSYFVLCLTLEIISVLVSDCQLSSSCYIFLKITFSFSGKSSNVERPLCTGSSSYAELTA